MSKFGEYLNEVKASRAWNNKLKRIDNLLSWMYDNEILKMSNKLKDRLELYKTGVKKLKQLNLSKY